MLSSDTGSFFRLSGSKEEHERDELIVRVYFEAMFLEQNVFVFRDFRAVELFLAAWSYDDDTKTLYFYNFVHSSTFCL